MKTGKPTRRVSVRPSGVRAPAAAALERKVELVKVSKIKPAAYNPRKQLAPEDPKYQELVKSFRTFGNLGGLVWNKRSGNLVAGHQRLKILRDVFMARAVQVAVVDLPPNEEKALNLRLNRHEGDWDDQALAEVLGELAKDKSIDAALSGFSSEEIAGIVKEGERLVEMLVPAEKSEDGSEESEEDEEESGGGGGGGEKLATGHQVVVECKSEKKAEQLFRKLMKEGYLCKLVTS